MVVKPEAALWFGLTILAIALTATSAELYGMLLVPAACSSSRCSCLGCPARAGGDSYWQCFHTAVVGFVRVTPCVALREPLTPLRTAQAGQGISANLARVFGSRGHVSGLGRPVIVQPEQVIYPLGIVGLLATPFLLRRSRAFRGRSVLFASEVGPMLLMFTPGLTSLVGRVLDGPDGLRVNMLTLPFTSGHLCDPRALARNHCLVPKSARNALHLAPEDACDYPFPS